MKRLTSNPAYLHPAMLAGLLKNVAAADNCVSGQKKREGWREDGRKRSEVTVQWKRHHGGSSRISRCPAISPYTHTHWHLHARTHTHTRVGLHLRTLSQSYGVTSLIHIPARRLLSWRWHVACGHRSHNLPSKRAAGGVFNRKCE